MSLLPTLIQSTSTTTLELSGPESPFLNTNTTDLEAVVTNSFAGSTGDVDYVEFTLLHGALAAGTGSTGSQGSGSLVPVHSATVDTPDNSRYYYTFPASLFAEAGVYKVRARSVLLNGSQIKEFKIVDSPDLIVNEGRASEASGITAEANMDNSGSDFEINQDINGLLQESVINVQDQLDDFIELQGEALDQVIADVAQNTSDIAQNTSDIAQNTSDIAGLTGINVAGLNRWIKYKFTGDYIKANTTPSNQVDTLAIVIPPDMTIVNMGFIVHGGLGLTLPASVVKMGYGGPANQIVNSGNLNTTTNGDQQYHTTSPIKPFLSFGVQLDLSIDMGSGHTISELPDSGVISCYLNVSEVYSEVLYDI
jgi:hypothetical protein